MSLKAFHLVFIVASILLCVGLSVWSLLNYFSQGATVNLVMGIGSALAAVALVVYERFFLRKLKNVSYL
jgi:hypothetical protein